MNQFKKKNKLFEICKLVHIPIHTFIKSWNCRKMYFL